MSCEVCGHNLRPETLAFLKPGQYATVFINEFELASSARASPCPECKLLFDAISLRKHSWTDDHRKARSIQLSIAEGKPLKIAWSDGDEFKTLQIFRQSDSTEPDLATTIPKVIGYAPLVPQYSGSQESLALVQSWLSECETSHSLCMATGSSQGPSRLIDLGTTSGTSNDLVLKEIRGERHRYMALSYCWGNPTTHTPLKTTRDTLFQHQTGISFATLPLTLQHVTVIARKLHFRYLWVDALCIVQDDEEDWKREAAKMCEVYAEAALTVFACSSDGSSGGIFGDQEYSVCTQIPYLGTYVSVSGNYARQHHPDATAVYGTDGHELDPIHKRAWTLQEAALSPRAVYFTSQEIRWECNSWRRCQCGRLSSRLPTTPTAEGLEYEYYRMWRVKDFFPVQPVKVAYHYWGLILATFTMRSLGVQSDRLAALSGLARRFATIMEADSTRKEEYLAGIWAGSLPQGLLWLVRPKWISAGDGLRHERPAVWRAPSWSWASMEAPIKQFTGGDLQSRAAILKAWTERIGPDPFGQVKSGTLHILGPLLRDIRFNHNPSAPGRADAYRGFTSVTYSGYELRLMQLNPDNDLEEEVDKFLTSKTQKFAILVIGYSPGGDFHEVLVLVPVPSQDRTFERFGHARLGPHAREPEAHKRVIEDAPREAVILV